MTQFQKSPNGGYLNKSNYGEDSWYGKVTITPELLAQAQATGAITVEVKDKQTTQYGECRRCVAKPYTPKAAPMGAPGQQQVAATNTGYAQPVMQQPVAQQPVAQTTVQDDQIPF